MAKSKKPSWAALKPGEFYEDCRYHPMVCIHENTTKDILIGISLIDGKVSCCSALHCGVRWLSPEEALRNRIYGLPKKLLETVMDPNIYHKSWRKEIEAERKRLLKEGIFFPEADNVAIEIVEHTTKKLRRKK